MEIDTSVENDLEQMVQRQCKEKVFGAATFSAFRYDDEQPNYYAHEKCVLLRTVTFCTLAPLFMRV